MAQNVRIELTCDACKQEGITNVDAETTPPITVGKYAPRMVDLCETHRKELYDPIAALLYTQGRQEEGVQRKRRQPKKQAVATPEPEPAPTVAPATKKRRSRKAVVQEHLLTADEFLCPEQGCTRSFPGNGFPKAQGLGAHRARTHGYRTGDDT